MNPDKMRLVSFITAVGIMAKSSDIDCFITVRKGKEIKSVMISEDMEFVDIGFKTKFPDELEGKKEMRKVLEMFADELSFHGVGIIETMKVYDALIKKDEDAQQYRNPN